MVYIVWGCLGVECWDTQEANAGKLTNTDLNAAHKAVMADVNAFAEQVSKTWHLELAPDAATTIKDRYSVNVEGPVEELSLDNLIAPHLDSSNTEEATKTMMDRNYVVNVYLVLCYRTLNISPVFVLNTERPSVSVKRSVIQ